MTGNRGELVGWLGGAVIAGLVFGLAFGVLASPTRGTAVAVAAAVGWLAAGAVRRARRRR